MEKTTDTIGAAFAVFHLIRKRRGARNNHEKKQHMPLNQ